MSGQKIDDHSFWAGKAEKGYVFPMEKKVRSYVSAEGAGEVGSSYPDTTEMVKRDQDAGISKAKSRDMKPGYRN